MATGEEIASKFVKILEESLADHLKDQIEKMITSSIKKHVDGLNKRLDSLTRTMDMWKSDLDEDRRTLQDITILSNKNQSELEQIRRIVNTLPRTVSDKVNDSVSDTIAESIPQAVSDSFDVTSKNVNSQVMVTEKPKRKRFWFFKIKRR